MKIAYWPADWCVMAAGAVLAGYNWGHLSAWWLFAMPLLGYLSGYLRGVATARERKQRGVP